MVVELSFSMNSNSLPSNFRNCFISTRYCNNNTRGVPVPTINRCPRERTYVIFFSEKSDIV